MTIFVELLFVCIMFCTVKVLAWIEGQSSGVSNPGLPKSQTLYLNFRYTPSNPIKSLRLCARLVRGAIRASGSNPERKAVDSKRMADSRRPSLTEPRC